MNNVIFEKGEHIYRRKNGMVVPSVTQLMQEVGLIGDMTFADPTLGIAVHEACRLWDAGKLPETYSCPPVERRLEQWKMFQIENDVGVCVNEIPMISRLGYAGTPDKVLRQQPERVIVADIKTSKNRSKATRVQLAMYKWLVEENYELKVTDLWEVVLLDDCFKIVPHEAHPQDRALIKSIINIHNYKRGNQ